MSPISLITTHYPITTASIISQTTFSIHFVTSFAKPNTLVAPLMMMTVGLEG
jgi:hypothetical protein